MTTEMTTPTPEGPAFIESVAGRYAVMLPEDFILAHPFATEEDAKVACDSINRALAPLIEKAKEAERLKDLVWRKAEQNKTLREINRQSAHANDELRSRVAELEKDATYWRCKYEEERELVVDHAKQLSTCQAQLKEAKEELAEMKSSYELRHSADMRAIKMWQKETGRELVWPDHADLCVWLLKRLVDAKISIDYLEHGDGRSL